MIVLLYWRDGDHFLNRLERHGTELWVVTYKSSTHFGLGRADCAWQRREPTFEELYKATARVLELSPKRRFAFKDSITGAFTCERRNGGGLVEHFHLFNIDFDPPTEDELRYFLVNSMK